MSAFIQPFCPLNELSCLPTSCFTNHGLSNVPASSQFRCLNYKQQQQHTQKLFSSSFSDTHFRIFSNKASTPVRITPTTTNTKRMPISLYLTERLGFSEELSLATSKKLISDRKGPRAKPTDLICYEHADNVISYLQECGLEHSHIQDIISKRPTTLAANVENTIKPKLKLLQDVGISSSDLATVLCVNPDLYLQYDLENTIIVLKDLMVTVEGLVTLLKRLKRCSAHNLTKSVIPNVTLLANEYGIPREKIRKLLCKYPLVFMQKSETFRDLLDRIEDKYEICRDSGVFLKAVTLFCGTGDEKIKAKCQLFRTYGWSESDVQTLIKRNPSCLSSSEARLKTLLEYFMSELGYEPDYLASRPHMFTLSLENRLVPRQRVLAILKEKGLIKADLQLYSASLYSEDRFVSRFISPYEKKVPNLLEVYGVGRALTEEL